MVDNRRSKENRTCPVCGTAIEGRPDKRYCCEKCRSLSNVDKRKEREAILNETLRILRHNRTVLRSLCPKGKAIVQKEVLDALQFDPSVFSSLFVNGKKQMYYLCCDYGFLPIQHDGVKKALIIRREAYAIPIDPWLES